MFTNIKSNYYNYEIPKLIFCNLNALLFFIRIIFYKHYFKTRFQKERCKLYFVKQFTMLTILVLNY